MGSPQPHSTLRRPHTPPGLNDHPGSGAARSHRTTPAPSEEQKRRGVAGKEVAEGGSGGWLAARAGRVRPCSPPPPLTRPAILPLRPARSAAPPASRAAATVPPRSRQGAAQRRRHGRAGRVPEGRGAVTPTSRPAAPDWPFCPQRPGSDGRLPVPPAHWPSGRGGGSSALRQVGALLGLAGWAVGGALWEEPRISSRRAGGGVLRSGVSRPPVTGGSPAALRLGGRRAGLKRGWGHLDVPPAGGWMGQALP